MSGGGSQSSSQSQGYGSSYSQSASLSLPENLQNPSAQAAAPQTMQALLGLSGILNSGAGGNPILQSFLAPYGGNFAAPVTQPQNQTLMDLGMAENGNYGYNPTAATEQNVLMDELTNPAAYATNIANQFGLAPFLEGAQTNPNAAGTSAAGAEAQAIAANDPALEQMLQPGYAASLAQGAPTQSVIAAALQPIQATFNAQTVPGLVGSYGAAGQRPTMSSAFGQAFTNAQAQEQATEASTAGSIVNSVYNTGLGQTGTAANNMAGLTGNAFNMGYGGALNLDQLFQGEYANIFGGALNNAFNAPSQLNTLNAQQASNLISTLNAQALPQLTEQLGINNALTTYNNSISSLMQALGLQVQAEQPVVGYESESASNSASFQNEESSGQSSSFNFGLPGISVGV